MSVQLFAGEILGAAKTGHRRLAERVIAKTVSTFVGFAHKMADEVAYAIREDFRHSQISRDPKDWER
ncbi:hypothetical protein NKI51_32100 [Mesorhizobium australicum]|uniref:hypothetical protein n=1 Tax=Mesorhizobium australicum TaxID=536018 RepID=UPI00333698F7